MHSKSGVELGDVSEYLPEPVRHLPREPGCSDDDRCLHVRCLCSLAPACPALNGSKLAVFEVIVFFQVASGSFGAALFVSAECFLTHSLGYKAVNF